MAIAASTLFCGALPQPREAHRRQTTNGSGVSWVTTGCSYSATPEARNGSMTAGSPSMSEIAAGAPMDLRSAAIMASGSGLPSPSIAVTARP
jgi:hypothetical protein